MTTPKLGPRKRLFQTNAAFIKYLKENTTQPYLMIRDQRDSFHFIISRNGAIVEHVPTDSVHRITQEMLDEIIDFIENQ